MNPKHVNVKVAAFTVAMTLVAAGLVVIFGQFRFAAASSYHANFANASRLQTGQDVRIAGVSVGAVKAVRLQHDRSVDVTFDVDKRYQLYTSTRAAIRYQNLIGDRYLEITSGPGELRKLAPGGTIVQSHTAPALDLDALLGGLRPVVKGLDGNKINQVSNAIIELLQGKGGALSHALADTAVFTSTLADRDQLIGDVIANLNTVLGTVNQRGAKFDAAVDRLQQLITGLAAGRDQIAGAIPPLASAATDLTTVLAHSRRPFQGVMENLRPIAAKLDEHKANVNADIEPAAEDYVRLAALGSYGAFFNIYFCSVVLKLNGPAGSDILLPLLAQPDSTRGRCAPPKS